MSNCPTPHISAEYGDFAKTVLMPGDPLRSKFLAENYLENARLVNNVRGVQGYTGTYRGVPVSVMASGMGMPSIGIYSYELFNFYGVENIIRIGSAGAIREDIKVKDILFAQGACTDSNYAAQFGLNGSFAPICDYNLLITAVAEAEKLGAHYKIGNLYSSDVFYNADSTVTEKWRSLGVLGVEMETAALYVNAAYAHKNALTICTVSDHVLTGESLSSSERESGFTEMMEIALGTAISL